MNIEILSGYAHTQAGCTSLAQHSRSLAIWVVCSHEVALRNGRCPSIFVLGAARESALDVVSFVLVCTDFSGAVVPAARWGGEGCARSNFRYSA